jgi:hypothetical protein
LIRSNFISGAGLKSTPGFPSGPATLLLPLPVSPPPLLLTLHLPEQHSLFPVQVAPSGSQPAFQLQPTAVHTACSVIALQSRLFTPGCLLAQVKGVHLSNLQYAPLLWHPPLALSHTPPGFWCEAHPAAVLNLQALAAVPQEQVQSFGE